MSSAPKPILIHGDEGGPSENESTTPTEAPPSTPTEPAGSAGASHPKATSNLAQVIERYETLNAQSNPSTPLSVLALVFLLGGPILAFSGLDNSMDFEEAANVCCGGLIIGFVLLLVASSQSHAYQKEVKQAFDAVKAEVNVSEPPKSYTLMVVASAMIGGGWLLAQVGASAATEIFLGIGVLLFITGLLTFATWLATNASSDNSKTKERILAAAKSKLQHSEEE
jgi:hypothetical protein